MKKWLFPEKVFSKKVNNYRCYKIVINVNKIIKSRKYLVFRKTPVDYQKHFMEQSPFVARRSRGTSKAGWYETAPTTSTWAKDPATRCTWTKVSSTTLENTCAKPSTREGVLLAKQFSLWLVRTVYEQYECNRKDLAIKEGIIFKSMTCHDFSSATIEVVVDDIRRKSKPFDSGKCINAARIENITFNAK